MLLQSNFLKLPLLLLKHYKILIEVVPFFRRPGGDRIYGVFDHQLPAAMKKLPLDRHLSTSNVRKVVSEADGYQPHLVAPEQGYRRLIDGSLGYFKGPAEASVDAVIIYSIWCNFSLYISNAVCKYTKYIGTCISKPPAILHSF